jgi:tetratricopeptide (TPR) repeat protein
MISVTRVVRLVIRFAAWVTPQVQRWHRERHVNRVEGLRHLGAHNWTEAEKHLSRALAERRRGAKERVELLLGLAQAQRGQRKQAEAEETTRLAIDTAVEAKDADAHSHALDTLVDLQLDLGQYAEAEQTTGEIARLQSEQGKPNRAMMAKCSRKLGTALLKTGRENEALEAFQKAADLSEAAFGTQHAETANNFVELGMLHRQQGNHPEAQKHLRRALEIHRAALGPDSLEAAQDLHHLSASLEESGDLDGAATELERLLLLRTRQVGANAEETADAQVRLASLYLRAHRPGPAKELLSSALRVLERKPGPRLAAALETLALTEEQFGRSDEAKRLREQAQSMQDQPSPAQ